MRRKGSFCVHTVLHHLLRPVLSVLFLKQVACKANTSTALGTAQVVRLLTGNLGGSGKHPWSITGQAPVGMHESVCSSLDSQSGWWRI